MNVRTLLLCLAVAAVGLLVLASCASAKYIAKPNEEIYRTWTNEKISAQKFVIGPDGGKAYLKLTDTTPFFETGGEIVSKWTDSEGNVWYKVLGIRTKGSYSGVRFKELDKVSKSGSVLESMWPAPTSDKEMKNPRYPARIDPKDPNYAIYYKAP